MKVLELEIAGPKIIEPDIYPDGRGFFFETYNRKRYAEHGILTPFVQENLSSSRKNSLRGLHYQYPHTQAKLAMVIQGEVLDLIVDIRKNSPTFGKWFGIALSAENKRQLFVPQGFAHGFCVLSNTAIFSYKCSDFYAPDCEKGILWSDPDINIDWPIENPILSDKDQQYPRLKDVDRDELFD
jgi:dTDP-4-dehydrorhamnose 3,5-epimerase